ncbi:MAG TPA: histidine phosphatase family protein [Gammaproteobacteria bacterium]|jgi:phosphohistidine phosphatase
MFDLMLVRHAKSDWHARKEDFERPLNKRGAEDARRMGKYLQEQGLVPDCMVVSGAKRAKETAQLLLDAFSLRNDNVIYDKELYLADWETLLEIIQLYARDNQRLLVLAHNPGMDDLVSYISSEPPALSESGKLMVTCAVAGISFDQVKDVGKKGAGKLQFLLRPKEIF